MILSEGNRKRKYFEKQALNHLKLLYFFALKLTRHREDAEDLVQETYHKAYSCLDQLRDMEKCKPWLYAIMVNTWKNWRTKRSREIFLEDLEERLDSGAGPDSNQIDPEKELMNKEIMSVVGSGLNRLPSHYRMAVLLSDIEGFTYKEISEIMGWPMGTVMSRLSRARRLLAGHLMKYRGKI